jgi:phosphoenolpyruvate carboxylase
MCWPALAQHLLRPDPNDSPVRWAEYRALVERTRFAAVFTAHPTFSLPAPVNHALAEAASGRPAPTIRLAPPAADHAGRRIRQPAAAIAQRPRRARPLERGDAVGRPRRLAGPLDRTGAAPVILSTWVGYDTDGRTDIGWWDTLRLRLEMKRLQLKRLQAQVRALPAMPRSPRAWPGAGGGRRRRLAACPDAPIRRASPPSRSAIVHGGRRR